MMKRIISEYSLKKKNINLNVLSSTMSNNTTSRWNSLNKMIFGYNTTTTTTTTTTSSPPLQSSSINRQYTTGATGSSSSSSSTTTTQESVLKELNDTLDYYYRSNDPSHNTTMSKLADKLVELQPTHYQNYLKSSTIYGERLGDYEHAVKDLRKAIELMIKAKVPMGDLVHHLHQLAAYYHKMDMYESAEDVYNRVMKLAPDNTANILLLASSRVARGDIDDEIVIGLFKKVLLKEPENINALLGLGTCLTSTGQLLEAEKLFQKVVDVTDKKVKANGKESIGVVAAMVAHESALRLGQLFQYRNLNEKAVKAFESALQYHPSHQPTAIVLAKTLIDIKQYVQAYTVISNSLAYPSEDIEQTFSCIEIQVDCLRHLKKYRESLEIGKDLDQKMRDCGDKFIVQRMNLLLKTVDTMINFVSERINRENQFSLTDFLTKKGKEIKKAKMENIHEIADYSNSIYEDLSNADVNEANAVIFFDDVASLYRDISIAAILLINNKSKFTPKEYYDFSKYLVNYYNSFWVKE